MEKINWKQKLTSRKFWAAVVGFVTALMIAFAAPQATITQVTGIITAGATLIAYIIGEGMIDAASAGATVNITGNPTITGVGDTPTAGQQATTPSSTPVIGTVDPAAVEGTPTGAAEAARVKQDTAESVQNVQA
jgi:uncharacterized membrane protein